MTIEPRPAFEEELVYIPALLFGHRLEREVVDDPHVDRNERDHLGLA